MALAPTQSDSATLRFVLTLTAGVHDSFIEAARPVALRNRRDKLQNAAYKCIERLEQFINDGVIPLPEDNGETLRRQLAMARSALSKKRGRASPYWALEKLTRALQCEFNINKTRIILAVARVTGLPCSERTARRMVTEARSS